MPITIYRRFGKISYMFTNITVSLAAGKEIIRKGK